MPLYKGGSSSNHMMGAALVGLSWALRDLALNIAPLRSGVLPQFPGWKMQSPPV